MKSLKQIREAKSGGKEAYQKFFNSLLKKFGVSSPSELEGDQKKKFYDELDAGWESDDPNDKNERYEDPEGLDPETTHDSDEDMADKAASQVNASYGKMNASKKKKMNAAYHKEDVNEAKKLKPGKGKAELDINWDGDRKDIKFATTKYKIKMKPHSDGAIISGDKAKLLAYLQGQDYAMDPEDIEDLYPELMESNYPKPLSIIRQNKVSDDALEEAYDMNEKMVMCEQCGKMHEEGACGDMNESEIHLDAKFDKFKKIKKSQYAAIKKKYSVTIDSDKTGSWAAGKPADLHKFAMAMGMSKDDIKKTYNHITPDYKGASNLKNKQREEVDEAMSMRSIGLKGASKRSRETGRKAKEGPALKGAKLGKSQPVLNRSQENEIHKIAKKHSGDMEKAMKEIGKMRVWKGKGIQDHPYVMDVLKKANETYDYGSDKAVKAAKKKTPGQKNEGVAVDRRTKGFKDAMIRSEKAKKVREKAKKKKEAKKDQAELDARYDYDGEVDSIISAASKVMMGTNETAANAVAHGGVDMAPNAGKKKKKELLARRGY